MSPCVRTRARSVLFSNSRNFLVSRWSAIYCIRYFDGIGCERYVSESTDSLLGCSSGCARQHHKTKENPLIRESSASERALARTTNNSFMFTHLKLVRRHLAEVVCVCVCVQLWQKLGRMSPLAPINFITRTFDLAHKLCVSNAAAPSQLQISDCKIQFYGRDTFPRMPTLTHAYTHAIATATRSFA